MKIEYVAPGPDNAVRTAQGKSALLHVGLRMLEPTKHDPQTGAVLATREVIHEVPVRKAKFDVLGPKISPFSAKQLTYANECHEFHGGGEKRMARRTAWDADDKAKADADDAAAKAAQDAADAAAKAAEYERFTVTPQGFAHDEKGEVTGVRVGITHQGHTCTANIGLVPSLAEENARVAWQASKDAADKMQAALNQFAVIK